jgi:hypothetical protein
MGSDFYNKSVPVLSWLADEMQKMGGDMLTVAESREEREMRDDGIPMTLDRRSGDNCLTKCQSPGD